MTPTEKDKLRKCPFCNNIAPLLLVKKGTQYFQCVACQTIFSDPLENDNMIGGVAEVERNEKENAERLYRVSKSLGGVKDGPKILDFGCGHGMFLKVLRDDGWEAEGYDLYNPEFNSKLPERGYYHLVMATEVIEHTSAPYLEVDVMFRALVPGGMVIIETSFVDIAKEDGIPLEDFFYISPLAGHSTIFSHHSLDLLMVMKGFAVSAHWNRHVRSYRKPHKDTIWKGR